MAPRLLFLLQEAFPGRSGGAELMPAIASDRLPRAPFEVILRAPGGNERRARATVRFAHSRGPLPPLAMLLLASVAAEALPAGTEVWVDDG